MAKNLSRKEFLKGAAMSAAGVGLMASGLMNKQAVAEEAKPEYKDSSSWVKAGSCSTRSMRPPQMMMASTRCSRSTTAQQSARPPLRHRSTRTLNPLADAPPHHASPIFITPHNLTLRHFPP